MLLRLVLAACAVCACLASSAFAAETFVGRWAVKPEACSARGGETAATASLVATDTSLSWFDGYCRIGKMYKAGTAIYLQARCRGKGDVPVTLDAKGDRMRVTWGSAMAEELRRCP